MINQPKATNLSYKASLTLGNFFRSLTDEYGVVVESVSEASSRESGVGCLEEGPFSRESGVGSWESGVMVLIGIEDVRKTF